MDTPIHNNSRPIWIYVLNFAALTLFGLAVVIAANMGLNMAFNKSSWLHGKLREDWTSNHVFTLADSTKKLLAQIDAKNQPWELAMDDSIPDADSNQASLRVTSTQVRDLLDEYAGDSRMIKVRIYGSGEREELEQKIRDHFLYEIKPYATALDHADSLLKDIRIFFVAEGAELGALSGAEGLDPAERTQWQRMQGGFEKQLPNELVDQLRKGIASQLNSTLPQYSQTVSFARDGIDKVVEILQGIISIPDSPDFKSFSAPAKAHFTQSAIDFKAELDKVQKVAQELGPDNLKPLAMDAVKDNLGSKAVVVFAPDAVKIVTAADMLHQEMGDRNAPPTVTFTGEQALSSTILTIIRPDKPKIVFVSASQSNLVQGAYSEFAGNLTAANFNVLEWSPASQDPANANPPAIGKGVVWVVFPPPAFDMQQMQMGNMPNTAPLVAAVRRHIELGGNALFLAEAGGSSPAMPGMGGGSGQYAFNDITTRFGINVKSQFTIWYKRVDQDGGEHAMPYVIVHEFEKDDITKSAQGFDTVLVMDRSTGQGGVTPLEISSNPPAGTIVKPLLIVNHEDYWATTNPNPAGKGEGDYDGPLDIIAAATQKKGADEQRIIVIGNAQVASNDILRSIVATEQGPQLQFPGNGELTTSSVMWLAGYDNMIAVSAKASAGIRIKDMTGSTTLWLDCALIFGLPILLMLLGGGIYFVRRR